MVEAGADVLGATRGWRAGSVLEDVVRDFSGGNGEEPLGAAALPSG